MGEPRLACSFFVSRGRCSNSGTARGGSSFVRRKKFLSCIASTKPVGKAVLCHAVRMQIERLGFRVVPQVRTFSAQPLRSSASLRYINRVKNNNRRGAEERRDHAELMNGRS